jgi:hypothetical protein
VEEFQKVNNQHKNLMWRDQISSSKRSGCQGTVKLQISKKFAGLKNLQDNRDTNSNLESRECQNLS